jgi:DNA modification methylase
VTLALPDPRPSAELEPVGELTAPERERLAELEAVVERGLDTFVEVGRALLEIRDARLYRETHATFEAYLRQRWGMSRQRGYQLIDAARVSTVVDTAGLPAPPSERVARELAPVLRAEGEEAALDVYREALASEDADADVTAEDLRRAYHALRRRREKKLAGERRKAELAERGRELAATGGLWEVRTGDCAEVLGDLPDGSVPLILTDPPYRVVDVERSYPVLAELAARLLVPGGSLLVYCGHAVMPQTLRALDHPDLTWWCALTIDLAGQAVIHFRRVLARHRPVLWYIRGDRRRNDLLVPSRVGGTGDQTKHLHPWAQGAAEVEQWIKLLSDPGETVLDPFCGSGTTGIAAIRLGRRFLGAEIDEQTAAIARGRLAEEERRLRGEGS